MGWSVSLLFLTASGLLAWWLAADPTAALQPSLPGMDHLDGLQKLTRQPVIIGEYFSIFSTEEEALQGASWPGFRGPDRDNIAKENIPLTNKFGNVKERLLWSITLGEGHAAPAVYKGRIYLLDYDEKEKRDALRCFSMKTGKELWRRGYKVHLKRNHGLSRTIPAVNEKLVVSIGPKCHVMCVDRITGDLKWGIDMEQSFGTEVPFWYTGQCPILAGDTVILAPGGKSLMVAVDGITGKILWETPNPRGWKMSHASVVRATIHGTPMYIYFAIGGVCGVAAQGPETGKVLWESDSFAPAVVAPSPVILTEGRILLTAGYGAGTAMIQVTRNGGAWKATVVQQFNPREGIASEQQTPVFYQGSVYSILPKDAGGARNQFVAASPSDVSKITVTSGKTERFGLGPYLLADGKFFILNDDGEMTIAMATAGSFKVLDKARIMDGQDAWGPLALSGGFMLVRDSRTMICLDMRKR